MLSSLEIEVQNSLEAISEVGGLNESIESDDLPAFRRALRKLDRTLGQIENAILESGDEDLSEECKANLWTINIQLCLNTTEDLALAVTERACRLWILRPSEQRCFVTALERALRHDVCTALPLFLIRDARRMQELVAHEYDTMLAVVQALESSLDKSIDLLQRGPSWQPPSSTDEDIFVCWHKICCAFLNETVAVYLRSDSEHSFVEYIQLIVSDNEVIDLQKDSQSTGDVSSCSGTHKMAIFMDLLGTYALDALDGASHSLMKLQPDDESAAVIRYSAVDYAKLAVELLEALTCGDIYPSASLVLDMWKTVAAFMYDQESMPMYILSLASIALSGPNPILDPPVETLVLSFLRTLVLGDALLTETDLLWNALVVKVAKSSELRHAMQAAVLTLKESLNSGKMDRETALALIDRFIDALKRGESGGELTEDGWDTYFWQRVQLDGDSSLSSPMS